MPTYSIKAPNGKTYQIDGPAGASDVQVRQQVLAQFPEAAGGSQPRAKTMTADEIAKTGMDAMGAMLGKMNVPSPVKGSSARSTPAKPQGKSRDAFVAGYSKGNLFSLPEYVSTAVGYIIPDEYHPTGNPIGDRGEPYDPAKDTFANRLKTVRAVNEYRMKQSPGAALAGNLVGAVNTGIGVSGGITKAGTALAATKAPAAVNALGRTLVASQTLKKGQTAANLAKLTSGAVTGSVAQAAGEGKDMSDAALSPWNLVPGAVYGVGKVARAVPKVIRGAHRPHSDNVGKALKEVVQEAPDAIKARQADLAARTGRDVPLVAALRDRDFTNVTERVLKNSPESAEIAKSEIAKNTRGFMDRMIGHVAKAGKASGSLDATVGDLAQLRKDSTDNLMKPIEDKPVNLFGLRSKLGDLEQQVTREIGGRIKGLGPQINDTLSKISPDDLAGAGINADDFAKTQKLLAEWGLGDAPKQVTVRDMDNLRRTLSAASKSAASNPGNSLAYKNAADAIREFTEAAVPSYGKVVDNHAAKSRMLEGFETAAGGKTLSDIKDTKLRASLQTPEGRVGLKAGELYRLREGANKSPSSAISLARNLAAKGSLTRQGSLAKGAAQPGTVTEHLGEGAAAKLADASEAEYQVLQRMMQNAGVDAAKLDAPSLDDPGTIVYAALLGKAMPITQARFVMKLMENRPFKQETAESLARMLFSTDPADSARAFTILEKQGIAKPAATAMMKAALPTAIATGSYGQQGPDTAEQPFTSLPIGEMGDDPAEDVAPDEAMMDSEAAPEEYGVAAIKELFPEARITSGYRSPDDPLSQANPTSYHTQSYGAVDLAPIPGMTFDDFVATVRDAGYEVVEAIDEVNNPSGHATGPHWHIVIA